MALTFEQQEIWNKFKIYYDVQYVKKIEFDDQNRLLITGDVIAAMGSAGLNVRFGKVNGSFTANGMGFRSLKGSPEEVTGTFSVARNRNLETLEGGPLKVIGDFTAYNCNLQNLIGAPTEVGGDFHVFKNPLDSLKGMPKQISGSITLNYEPSLGMLRTLVAQKGVSFNTGVAPVSWDKVIKCQDIINKYAGQGKIAIFDCQKDLEDAGFPENARW